MWRHSVSENQPVAKDVDRSLEKMPAAANGQPVDPESTGCHGHQTFFLGQAMPFLQSGMSPLLCGHGDESRTRSIGSRPSLTEAGSSCGVDSMSSPGTFSPVVNPAMVTSSHSLPPLDTPGFACAPDEMPRTTNYQTQVGVNAVNHSGYSTVSSHLPGCPHAHGMYVTPWNQSTKGFYEGHPSPGPIFAETQFSTTHHPGTYASHFQCGPTASGPTDFVPSSAVVSGPMESSQFATQNPMEYGINTPISSSSIIHEEYSDTAKQTHDHIQGAQHDSKEVIAVSSPSSEKYDPACFPEPELSQGRKSEIYNAKPQRDGMYHCYFEETEKCGHEPVKLKCNYDKYIDSHLKPWKCKVPGCEDLRFSSTACRLRHEREAHGAHGHGMNPYLCLFAGCERAQPDNGFPRSWNRNDHMKRCHNYKIEDVPSPTTMDVVKNVSSAGKQAPRKKSLRDSKRSGPGSNARGKSQTTVSRKNSEPPGPGHSGGITKTNKLRNDWQERRASLQQQLERLENPIDFLENHKQLREEMEAMSGISRELCSHE